jgi:hypothetical protein
VHRPRGGSLATVLNISPSVAAAIAVIALAVAVLAVGVAIAQARRFGRYRRSFGARLRKQEPGEPIPLDAAGLGQEVAALHETMLSAVQRVGLVRFDAFEDMGGQLSFALALLDADGTGVVLSSINGRREARVYAKAIESAESAVALSDEEREAIRRAMGAVLSP